MNINRMYNTAKTVCALDGKLMDAGNGFMLFLSILIREIRL
ncbi:MAG: hypothetical protein QXZ12_08750 [Thermoplasmata archaeon]